MNRTLFAHVLFATLLLAQVATAAVTHGTYAAGQARKIPGSPKACFDAEFGSWDLMEGCGGVEYLDTGRYRFWLDDSSGIIVLSTPGDVGAVYCVEQISFRDQPPGSFEVDCFGPDGLPKDPEVLHVHVLR